jgi:hypothetical protein
MKGVTVGIYGRRMFIVQRLFDEIRLQDAR